MMDKNIEARLRAIVTANVIVGGYPDTMAIARAAYELGRQSSGSVAMTLDRTKWSGSVHEEQTTVLDRWIVEADADTIERLMTRDIARSDIEDQRFLAQVWIESGGDPEDGDGSTYHWGEGERIRFRRAVARLRPSLVEPDPDQGFLL